MSRSTPDERTGVRLRVEGVVQGVGFRWWTRERAVELNVVGTVRNLPDDSVEVIAFGTPDALSQFQRLVSKGPAPAVVERVHESPVAATQPPPHNFRILQ